jgi:hypothetical protein
MAANSAVRGVTAFVVIIVAVPIQVCRVPYQSMQVRGIERLTVSQDSLGDGWMYTIWAAVIVVGELLLLLTVRKGTKWREEAGKAETPHAESG